MASLSELVSRWSSSVREDAEAFTADMQATGHAHARDCQETAHLLTQLLGLESAPAEPEPEPESETEAETDGNYLDGFYDPETGVWIVGGGDEA